MRNINIVKGWRAAGLEDTYAADPLVNVLDGDIIDVTGQKVTLLAEHIECGIAIQPTNLGATGYKEASGKIPVYTSNFIVRTKRFQPAVYAVGDPISVKDGIPTPLDATNTVLWGYVTKVNQEPGTIDIRVNY